jgi:hypothetical protein
MDAQSFNCRDTPIAIPAGFDLKQIPKDGATLRLVSPVAGTGQATPLPIGSGTPNGEGLALHESTLTELRVNQSDTNNRSRNPLLEARLSIPAAHSFPGVNAVAELFLYFSDGTGKDRDTADGPLRDRWICLSITCVLGADTDPTAQYFTSLTPGGTATNRPVLTKLFAPTDTFLEYRGADLRGRTYTNPRPRDKCDAPSYVRYFVCTTPISIGSQATVDRLASLASGAPGKIPPGPPRQGGSTSQSDLTRKVSRIDGIRLGDPASTSGLGRKATSALKCYRIDPEKDVKNGRVTIGRKSKTTLAEELLDKEAAGGQTIGVEGSTAGSVQPGDVEFWLAIAGALLLTTILVGVLYYFGFSKAATAATGAAVPATAATASAPTATAATGASNAATATAAPNAATPAQNAATGASQLAVGFAAGLATILIIGLIVLSISNNNYVSWVLAGLVIVALVTPGLTLAYWFLNRETVPASAPASASPAASAAATDPAATDPLAAAPAATANNNANNPFGSRPATAAP